MKKVFAFIGQYFKEVNKPVLVLCTSMTAILIFLNYYSALERRLVSDLPLPFSNFTGHFLLFISAFSLPYIFYLLLVNKNYFKHTLFILLLIIAPCIFALKISINTDFLLSTNYSWNHYWNQILYWPLRVLLVTGILYLTWKSFHKKHTFYGLSIKYFSLKPYLLMLILMIPLIVAASTQHDFLMAYPKLNLVLPLPAEADNKSWFYKLLFELSYGSDFFSIELFFRGFLVLGFVGWAGKDAILPMACFYCTIHFGKPLGECISSYFGGILLGIVTYHTRSIFGGLVVHLGIAWLMELFAVIGNSF